MRGGSNENESGEDIKWNLGNGDALACEKVNNARKDARNRLMKEKVEESRSRTPAKLDVTSFQGRILQFQHSLCRSAF